MDEKAKQLMAELRDRAIREDAARKRITCAGCVAVLILPVLYVLSIGPVAWTIKKPRPLNSLKEQQQCSIFQS